MRRCLRYAGEPRKDSNAFHALLVSLRNSAVHAGVFPRPSPLHLRRAMLFRIRWWAVALRSVRGKAGLKTVFTLSSVILALPVTQDRQIGAPRSH
jgi:hypothetical protein